MARLLSLQETASHLGISLSQVRKLVQRRELAVIRLGPRTPRIEPDELNRFLIEKRVPRFLTPKTRRIVA